MQFIYIYWGLCGCFLHHYLDKKALQVQAHTSSSEYAVDCVHLQRQRHLWQQENKILKKSACVWLKQFQDPCWGSSDRWTVNNLLSDKKPAASLLQSVHCPWPLPQDGPALCCLNSSTSFLVRSGHREFSLSRGQRHFCNCAIRAFTLSFLFTALWQKPEGKKKPE